MLNSDNPEIAQTDATVSSATTDVLTTEVVTVGATPTEPAPPRRRRAASRPAGPPVGTVQANPATPVDAPAVADDEPVADGAPVATGPADGDSEPVAASETLVEAPAGTPPPRRSRRRSAAPADPTPAPLEAGVVEGPGDEAPLLPEAESVTAPPARRRRRASAADSAQADLPEQPSADDVGASLEALAQSARGRRRRSPEPAVEASAVLDSLAAAIGGKAVVEPSVTETTPATEDAEPDALVDVAADLVESDVNVGDVEPESADDHPESDEGTAPPAAEEDADEEPESDEAAAETTAEEAEGDESDADAGEPDADGDTEGPRRRRRRRGGRRRRRGAGTGPEDETDDAGEPAEVADTDEQQASDESSTDEPSEGTGRRRRRRRRRGEDVGAAEDDPSDVVVRVREPRRTRSTNDEVTGIEGSTRMEAKRQRRRDGRAAGRRRAPILSEAEFLARRESVDRRMLIRQADDYTQIGVVEDGVLVEHYVDRASATSLIGNVYLGRVQNVLPSMEAAFIDIGRGRNAVIYAGEIDWDAFGVTGSDRKVERVLKSGQSILVQVSKDPVGAKGARLTAHVSIPGRYVVYSPSGQLSGISRKLPESERSRLKGILDQVVDGSASVIVRTAAEGASEEELIRDVSRLKAQWEVVEKKVKAGKSPELLYAEPDLTVRIVRDLFTEDFTQLVVDGNGKGEDAYDTIDAYVRHVAPHLAERLVHWNRDESGDLFDQHRIDEQIAKALERKVFLPSGGSLVIDRTEAMTVVDVNTGKFTGTSGNLEATVTSNNLEAAEEIVRQLRLRDIGGIIVIDFIDMVLPSNRELLLRRLVECLGRDRTRHQVAEVTSLGLVQMTRKKIGTGLAEAFTVECETCHGRGYHRHDTPVETQAPADGGDRDQGRGRRRN